MAFRKEHRTAIIVALITLAVLVFVVVFRNGTSW
jgi:hypothetical protein